MYLLVFLWIPSYFTGNFGVDTKQSTSLSVAPWCCAIVATVTAGLLADALHNRGVMQLTNVRRLMQGVGSIGPAACLFYLAWLNKASPACSAHISTMPDGSANQSLAFLLAFRASFEWDTDVLLRQRKQHCILPRLHSTGQELLQMLRKEVQPGCRTVLASTARKLTDGASWLLPSLYLALNLTVWLSAWRAS